MTALLVGLALGCGGSPAKPEPAPEPAPEPEPAPKVYHTEDLPTCDAPARTCTSWSPPPSNPGSQAQARALYTQGQKHYENARFLEAVAAFEQAYAASGLDVLLFNIGQAYRQAGEVRCAIDALEHLLDRGTTGSVVDAARARLADLREANDCEPSGDRSR